MCFMTHSTLNSSYDENCRPVIHWIVNIISTFSIADAIKIHSGATSYCGTPQQATEKLQTTWWEITALIKTLGPQLASIMPAWFKVPAVPSRCLNFCTGLRCPPKWLSCPTCPLETSGCVCHRDTDLLTYLNTDFTLCGNGWLFPAHPKLCFDLWAYRIGLTHEKKNTCPPNQTLSHSSVYPCCASVSSWQDLKRYTADAPKHS